VTECGHKATPVSPHRESVLIACGIGLVILHGVMAWLSNDFAYTRPLADKPILTMVCLQLAAGVVFLFAVTRMVSGGLSEPNRLPLILGIGIALRVITLPSAPVLENDFYRYLWDGALTAHGINPYLYSPAQALSPEGLVPPLVSQLADQSGVVVFRVNHPDLRTIYPPVAQAAFAAAYMIQPWSLLAWKFVLALFDAATLVLLLAALRSIGAAPAFAAIYWWNPLVVREIYSTVHMDILAVPWALAAVLLWTRKRHIPAVLSLIVAVGTKVWPMVLLPVMVLPLREALRRNLLALAALGIGCLFMLAPQFLTHLNESAGILAYSTKWEMNDALYTLFLHAVEWFGSLRDWSAGQVQVATRIAVACLLAASIGWSCRMRAQDDSEVWGRALFAVAALFLVSPTEFPWYYLWVIPFLTMRYRFSLLLLSVLLSLYYVRFFFSAHEKAYLFDTCLVWIEYGPVLALLLYEWYSGRHIPQNVDQTQSL
jgi:hypothetical protein